MGDLLGVWGMASPVPEITLLPPEEVARITGVSVEVILKECRHLLLLPFERVNAVMTQERPRRTRKVKRLDDNASDQRSRVSDPEDSDA